MNKKRTMRPGTMLNPVPAVLVSCAEGKKNNLITIAWTGIINSDPPMTYISVRKERYSHSIISKSREFVINLVNEDIVKATDFCGVKSGREIDKFEVCRFTAIRGDIVSAPLVSEAPVNLECKVKDIIEFPSHDMFIAEIVSVHADEGLFDDKDRIRLDKAGMVAYNHGEYFSLKKSPIGKFGYSVMKPSTKKRIEREKRSRTSSYKTAKRRNINDIFTF